MKLKTKIKHCLKKLNRRALREPKTREQIKIRLLWERVSYIWRKRYE